MERELDDQGQNLLPSGLSTEQLLLLEIVCDRFEADFKSGKSLSIEEYLRQLPQELHVHARAELKSLEECLQRACATQTAESSLQASQTLARALPDSAESSGPFDFAQSRHQPNRSVRAGRFELHELLGSGGAGSVWKAFDRHLARWVAFKIPLTNTSLDADRFLTEARTAARLHHPHIVRVLDAGRDELGCFIVSELVEGITLADKIRQGRFDAHAAAELLSVVAGAVAHAHQSGIVHRDLKPQNILIDAQGRPMVLDFGLACEWFVETPRDNHGKILGTPAYMAPEQAAGQTLRAEPRTDVYALGVILFQLLTGELPFRGDVASVLHQVKHVDAPQAMDLNPSIPKDLNTLCQCCLEKMPARRLASAAFLRDELQRVVNFQPIQSRPSNWRSRIAKWSYRNPTVAALTVIALAMVGLLLAGAMITTIVISRAWEREYALRLDADRERNNVLAARDQQRASLEQAVQAEAAAQQSRSRAEAESRLSQASLQYLESMIQSSDPVSWILQTSVGPVTEAPKLADWLDAAAERTRTELIGQPRVQARMLDTLANGCRSLGRYAAARQLLDQAELIRHAATAASEMALPEELVRHQFYRALLWQDTAELSKARVLLTATLDEARALKPSIPLLEADIQFHLGWNHSLARDFDAARPHFQRALEIRQEVCTADSGLIKAAQLALDVCGNSDDDPLSVRQLQLIKGNDRYSQIVNDYLKILAWRQLGRWDVAIDAYQPMLDQLATALPPKHPLIVLAQGEYAEVCWRGGDFRRALPAIKLAIAWAEELSPEHLKLREAREKFGSELLRAQRFAEAGEQFQRLIDRDRQVGDRFSPVAVEGMVWVHLVAGRSNEAIELAQQLLNRTTQEAPHRRAWYYYVMARAAALAEDQDLERKCNTESYSLACSLKELPQNGLWLERLSNIYTREQRLDRSVEIMSRAIECERETKSPHHPHLGDRLMTLAKILRNLNRLPESKQAYEEAQAIYKQSLPDDDIRLRTPMP